MSRKEGIIHLGRSKSPERFRNTAYHTRVQSIRSSREKQPLRETEILNNSMHIAPQQFFTKQQMPTQSNTSPGFYPSTPKNTDKVIIKENRSPPNRTTIVHNSPIQRVIVSRPLSIHGEELVKNQASHLIVQQSDNGQLLRKIRMLQGRVKQLHQQKQACIIKTHEQNKKLFDDNSMLKAKLNQIDIIKSQQINNLRQEVNFLRSIANSQRLAQVETSEKPSLQNKQKSPLVQQPISVHSSLKNAAYTHEEQENSATENLYEKSQHQQEKAENQNSEVLQQNLKFHEQIQRLSQQNENLKAELKDIKQSFSQHTETIQSNNRQIVESYESKIQYLENELRSSNQKLGKQKELQQSLLFCKGQIEGYVQRNLQKCQEMMRLEDTYKYKIQQLEGQLKQSRESEQNAVQKSVLMELLVNEKQCEQTSCSTETQTEQQKSMSDSCQKCKQLVKTLVKLNQKAFSKTN